MGRQHSTPLHCIECDFFVTLSLHAEKQQPIDPFVLDSSLFFLFVIIIYCACQADCVRKYVGEKVCAAIRTEDAFAKLITSLAYGLLCSYTFLGMTPNSINSV